MITKFCFQYQKTNFEESNPDSDMKYFAKLVCLILATAIHLNVFTQSNVNMKEKNLSIAKQFYNEVINKGDNDLMKSIMSENFVDHYAAPNIPKGIEGFKQFLGMVGTAFPDIQVTVDEMFCDDDKVAVCLTVSGSHTGILLGSIPPTGKHAVWTGIDVLKIESGKITERWSQRDIFGMMKQIGVVK